MTWDEQKIPSCSCILHLPAEPVPLVPLHLIWKPFHGPVTPIFSWDYRQGASICSNPSLCHSRANVDPIIIFLSPSQIWLKDLYAKQQEPKYTTYERNYNPEQYIVKPTI